MTILKQQLITLHEHLVNAQSADAETRQLLLILLADISRLLHAEVVHTEVAEVNTPAPAEALETLAARFDVDHPALSNALRQLVDALSKAGI